MRKFFSLIAAVLFAGSMMASEAIMQYTGGVTTNMVGDGANNAATVGLDADLFTVLAEKGANQNLPGLNKANDIRLYADKNSGNGNTITVSIASGTITSIVLDIKQTATFVVKAGETAVTEEDGAYAINATSFSIQNTTTGVTTQLQLNKITITYESGDVPPTPTMDYYVAGSMTNWGPMAAYKLAANPANEGEYMGEFTFAANDEFKVGYSDGTTIESTNYFPNGIDNNYVITEAGDYTVYFRPDGQGGEDWHYGCIKAIKKEAPAAISCLEVYQKAKNDAVLLNPVTVTYSNGANVWVMDGSASMLIYLPSGFTNNFQAGDVLSGVAGVVDIYQNIVYEVKPDATQAAAIVATPGEAPAPSQAAVIEASDVNKYVILPGFSIEGEFTTDSKTSLPAVLGENTVTIYNNFKFAYTFEAGKTYDIIGVVSAYKGNPQVYFISAEEAGGEVPPTPSINYYVAGSMNGWAANEAYILTPNNENLYEGEFTFAANDEFKVIGFDGETTTWFPEGMGNNFQITEAGDYKITFNPAGNVEGWYEGFFNVVKKEEPVVPGEEINVTISSLTNPGQVLYADVIASSGYWDIYAFNDQYQIEISNISTTEAAGTYTIDDLDADFTYIVPAEGDTVHFTAGQVVLSITDGVVNVAGKLTGDDNNIYNINLTYKDPVAEQTVNVNITEGVLYDGYAAYGLYAVYGSAEDGTYVQLAIWTEAGFEGQFTEEDLDNKYVGSGLKDAAGNTQQIYAAAITVTPGAIEGAYTITADLLCYNNTLYKVTMKIGEEQGIDNVDAAVKAIKRLVNGQVVIEKNNKFYNINGAVIR